MRANRSLKNTKTSGSFSKRFRLFLVLTLLITLFQNINVAQADGNGISFYWRADSGATTGSTYGQGQLTEFNPGTATVCHSASNASINYAWGSGGPGGTCPSDGFTSFGFGYIFAPWTGIFTFCDQSDDGFWLRIESTNVINNWQDQGAQTGQNCNGTGTISLTKGQWYSIKVFQHENGGGADMRLLWKYDAMTSYSIVDTKFLSDSGSRASVNISSVLPFYGRGNNTYAYGLNTSINSCGSNQTTTCVYTLSVGQGFTPYTYSLVGSLPSILTVNSSTGSISYNASGTFTAGTYGNLRIRATDFYGQTSDSGLFSISLTEPLVPTFGTYTRTADGFTVQISNYDSNFTWAGTATAGGSVSISGTGLATISGVAPGTNSVATITTTRVSYDAGSAATASTQSLLAQTVTWSPTTTALVQQSPLTPSTSASALGGATISYSVTSAGITSCAVNSNTGVLTYNAPGVCVVRASAAATSSYASATRDVTFNLTSISAQPASDTTTAGLTNTFSLTTVSAPSPLTRTIKWQVATDTTTAVGSVAWSDVSSGSGFTTPSFTTVTLTTSMNKYRYRSIVTFSGVGGTSVETSTVATLTINPAISITSTTSTITQKYGAGATTRTVTFTGGTDTRTVSASSLSLASGRLTFETSTARFAIDTRTAVGTYLDTITITDAKGATASYTQTITVTVADTLTVTSDTPTALTFTGSEAVFTPTVSSVSGLVSGDVISGATYTYSATALSCANGGPCSIGQTGPGGGLVFITPTTVGNTTGKYFEAAAGGWNGMPADPVARLCTNATSVAGASGTAIGTGETNTNLFAASAACGASVTDTVTALVLGGKDDWFLPSFDELKEMYSKLHKAAGGALGGFALAADNYLSSSDNPSGPYGDFGPGYALYGWFGSANGIVGWGSTSKTEQFAYRPVRSFVATSTSTINYGPSTTKPTGAGTYTITPSALTFSDGAASNYVNVTYRTSTLTINKAAQAALTIVPLYLPFNSNPTTATLLTTGGSDTGTVTFAYVASGSTAGGCTLSGADSSTVTVTSAGTCRIVATRAATNNFLVAISDTGTVTFYLYVSFIPAPRPAEYPAEIVLSGATAMTNNGLAPTITFTGTDISAAPGALFTISGSGFVGTRLVRVSGVNAAFTVLSDTSLRITMPAGLTGMSGPIYVEKAEGSRASEDWVVGTA